MSNLRSADDSAAQEDVHLERLASLEAELQSLRKHSILKDGRVEALLRLPVMADELDEKSFIQKGLFYIEDLTRSQIACIHFIKDDTATIDVVTWSHRTLDVCDAATREHYPISEAGIWADAVRSRGPVVFNEYQGYKKKRGLPEGHSPLSRLISVPVLDRGVITMVVGVGNKDTDYSDDDVETVQLLANEIWRIVQHRRTEKAHIDAEERYRSLFEESPISLWEEEISELMEYLDELKHGGVSDLRRHFEEHPEDVKHCARKVRVLDVNKATLSLRGVTEKKCLLGTLETILTDSSYGAFKEELIALSDGRNKFVGASEMESESGESKQVLVQFNRVGYSQTGTDKRVIVATTDLTERTRADEELRRFEQIVSSTPDMLALIDRNFVYLAANEAYLETIGRSRGEVIGTRAEEIFEGDYFTESILPRASVCLKGETVRFQRWISFSIEERRFMDITYSPYPAHSDEILGFVVAARDHTELKKGEDEREKLALAIHQAAETILITDADAKIEYVNPAFERVSGYTAEEAIGSNPRILSSGVQDTGFYEAMWKSLLAGEYWNGRFVNRRKDGSFYTEEATITPVLDESGKIVNYVAVKHDITDRLKFQEQARQSQKLESIGLLAGGVAHDFNNLLGVIIGNSEMAMEKCDPSGPEYSALNSILNAGLRSAELTEQLLAFARKQTVAPSILDLNEAVEKILKMTRRLIGEDIDLKWHPCTESINIYIDPAQFDQVLTNLCVNARDAIAGIGSLQIESALVSMDSSEILDSEVSPGDFGVVSVTDSGPGMSADIVEKIFDPFFTTKEVGMGTGLGLSTVFGIVKQNNGFIRVDSRMGAGSTFNIYFPICLEKAQAETTSNEPEEFACGTETILISEDESSIVDIVQTMLERCGYRVLASLSPEEAIQTAESFTESIDLLITDIIMPTMNGRDLAERLAEKRPDLKCLFMSGYTADIISTRGILEDGMNFLQKPFSSSDLLKKVRETLDG